MKICNYKSSRFSVAKYSLLTLVLALLLASCFESGSSSSGSSSKSDNTCTEILPGEQVNDSDCIVYLYATNAKPDLQADTDFKYGEWGSGSKLEGNYKDDADFSPVFQVVSGSGWGDEASCLAMYDFKAGFAAPYKELVFKIKDLTEDVFVKFPNPATPAQGEVKFNLADYAKDISGTTGWKQVTIPLSDLPFSETATEFGIHSGTGNGGTFLITDIGFSGVASTDSGDSSQPKVELPITFEQAITYSFADFDGGSAVVINNPQSSGINTSSKVGQMVKDGGQTWGGSTLALDSAIDFTQGKVFTIKVWSTRIVPVLMQLEGQNITGGKGNAPNVIVQHPGGSAWQELKFDFSDDTPHPVSSFTSSDPAKRITLIFDNGTLGDYSDTSSDWLFYFDDIEQVSP